MFDNILPSVDASRLAKAVHEQQEAQLAWITVAAAVAGGLVAGVMAARDGKPLAQSIFSFVAGVSFGIFGGPFLADKTGLADPKSALFVIFLSGLLGAVLVDQIAEHSGEISKWVLDRIMAIFNINRDKQIPPEISGIVKCDKPSVPPEVAP